MCLDLFQLHKEYLNHQCKRVNGIRDFSTQLPGGEASKEIKNPGELTKLHLPTQSFLLKNR